MEGVQVKLNNAYRWKVSVCEDIPELGAVGSARAPRKRAATDLRKKVFHTLNHYEIVVDNTGERILTICFVCMFRRGDPSFLVFLHHNHTSEPLIKRNPLLFYLFHEPIFWNLTRL